VTVALSGMTLVVDNDTQEDWAGTDDLDDYNVHIEGTNSESWNVAKNASETGTLTLASAEAMSTSRGIFVVWTASNLSQYYTDVTMNLESTSGNDLDYSVAVGAYEKSRAVSGDFKAIALDFINKGTETGTFAPGNLNQFSMTVDNSSSGNIRAVINTWIDAMYHGVGHTISSTTVGDKLFTEATAIDEAEANRYGVLSNVSGIIYSQGDLTLSGTALTSNGETLVFKDNTIQTGASTWVNNGFSRYNLDITGTITFVNTNILAQPTVDGTTNVDFDVDGTSATAFSMSGGSITQANALTLVNGQTFSGVVLTDINTSSIANDPIGCTWNLCGLITMQTGGSLENCTLNKPSGAIGVDSDDLDVFDNCTFISDGTGHAVDMNISATDTQGWNCTDSGYTAASSGNETIKVTISSPNILTINVASGATSPSVYVVGTGTVSVVSGQVTMTVTCLDKNTKTAIEGVAVTVLAKNGTGPLPFEDSVTITRSGSVATVSHTAHGLATGKKILISGAVQNEYNRIKTITYINANSYSYTVSGTPTTPATGTIKATAIVIDGLTNASGVISDTRSYSTTQPVSGSGRRGSSSPVYEPNPIDTTIDTANGATVTLLMIPD